MVKVHFHAGMHRSGTSSIQFVLRNRFGNEVAGKNWYPIDGALGEANGHAGLAQPFNNRAAKPAPDAGIRQLCSIREQAQDCDSLIISSENFSYASNESLREIGKIFDKDQLHLIFTVAPMTKRAVSLWTAQIQFGGVTDFEDARDSIVAHEIFNPNYFDRLHDTLAPDTATLIVTDPNAPPVALLENFFKACDLPLAQEDLTENDTAKKNRSPGMWEIQMVRQFNLIFSKSQEAARNTQTGIVSSRQNYHEARKKLQTAVFRTPEWSDAVPHTAITLPESYVEPLSEKGVTTRAHISKLVADGKLSVIGDVEVLFAGLRME